MKGFFIVVTTWSDGLEFPLRAGISLVLGARSARDLVGTVVHNS